MRFGIMAMDSDAYSQIYPNSHAIEKSLLNTDSFTGMPNVMILALPFLS